MPRRKKGGAGVGGGGGASGGPNLGNLFGGGDPTSNPDFGAAPGDITPSFTGDPSALSQQPVLDNSNWVDKVMNKPNAAEAINNAYILQKALGKLQQQEGLQNVGQVNPDYLAISNKQPVEHDFNDENFNANTVMPFTGGSLGSLQGNVDYAKEGAAKDLADKSDLIQSLNKARVARDQFGPLEEHTQRMSAAQRGINPENARGLSPNITAAFTSGLDKERTGNILDESRLAAQIPNAGAIASADSDVELDTKLNPEYKGLKIAAANEELKKPGLLNNKLQEVDVAPRHMVYTPGMKYTGESEIAHYVPDPPQRITDPTSGKVLGEFPSHTKSRVTDVVPGFAQRVVGNIGGHQVNVTPPPAPPAQDNSDLLSVRPQYNAAPMQGPPIQDKSTVIPSKTAPQANTVSPANLLLQYLKLKGKSIFDTMTSTSGPTR